MEVAVDGDQNIGNEDNQEQDHGYPEICQPVGLIGCVVAEQVDAAENAENETSETGKTKKSKDTRWKAMNVHASLNSRQEPQSTVNDSR